MPLVLLFGFVKYFQVSLLQRPEIFFDSVKVHILANL